MTNLTSGFLGIQKVRLPDGAMRIVAHTALLKHYRILSMDLGKPIPLAAIETTTLENKTSSFTQPVAFGTRHIRKRRMLSKRLKASGRIHPDEKVHFLLPAIPHQN
jgi:hypothetical protein